MSRGVVAESAVWLLGGQFLNLWACVISLGFSNQVSLGLCSLPFKDEDLL